MRRTLPPLATLAALLLALPAALAGVGVVPQNDAEKPWPEGHGGLLPNPEPEPALGSGGVDPWVDAAGDTMTGTLVMGAQAISFQGGTLSSTNPNDLRFAGQKVCTQGAAGCTGTTYTAGSGLALTGTQFSVATAGVTSAMIANGSVGVADVDTASVQARVSGACAAGSSIRSVNAAGGVTCETDDDTQYAAGTALTLTGNVFAVGNNAVGAAQIANNAVTMDELSVPIASLPGGNAPLAAGMNHIYSATAFVAPSSGTCLVTINTAIATAGANSAFSAPILRVAWRVDGVDNADTQGGFQYPSTMDPVHLTQSRTQAISVTADKSYQFGGRFQSVGGDWVGDFAFVKPSYICV